MAKIANYKISIELEKLKIHVEGSRELAPEIANNVASQIATILQPARLIEGSREEPGDHSHLAANVTPATPGRRPRRKGTGKLDSAADGAPLNWTHDPAKWGTPVQNWSQPKRIMWLLAVVEKEAGQTAGLTVGQIAETFNAKFKEAGLIVKQNVKRDLARQTDNFGVVDGRWFLKQGGKTEAVKLVEEAKGAKTT